MILEVKHTRISHANTNISALERSFILGKGLLQSLQRLEFNISESLWLAV